MSLRDVTRFNPEIERREVKHERAIARVEQRDDGTEYLTGYAAVFYREDDPATEFELWDGFVERLMPTAFDSALKRDDVRALFNHDPNEVIGRTAEAGTLKLSVDKIGLRYEIDPPKSAAKVVEAINRRDVTGSSFGFRALNVTYREVGEITYREIEDLELIDVGPVTFPAYTGTTSEVAKRSLEEWQQEREQLEQQQREDRARELRMRIAAASVDHELARRVA